MIEIYAIEIQYCLKVDDDERLKDIYETVTYHNLDKNFKYK